MTRVTDKRVAAGVEGFFQRPDIAGNIEILARRLPSGARILIAGWAIRNLIIDFNCRLIPGKCLMA